MISIIPAIDIIDGKCVRLQEGNYSLKTVYNEYPLEVAKQFEANGLERLHLVDLDGAKKGEVRNWKVLEQIAGKTRLSIDFSGGLRTGKSVQICFDCGANYASIGSLAVKDEFEFTGWIMRFGAEKFIIGADVRDDFIQIAGWTEPTTLSVFDLIHKYKEKGINRFFCTDISKDGLLKGSAEQLYLRILEKFPDLFLIASGGISSLDEIQRLEDLGCSGAIIGKAIYENKISLPDLTKWVVR